MTIKSFAKAAICITAGLSLLSGVPGARAAGVLFVRPAASGAGDCASWADACSLQTALGRADPGEEIWAAAGVHYPGTARADSFWLVEGVQLYGGFTGTETERGQRDWMGHTTVLSGDIGRDDTTCPNGVVMAPAHIVGENAYHVLRGSALSAATFLDGFVITAGQANGVEGSDGSGGGLLLADGQLALANLSFRGNTAQDGGGMHNAFSSPTLATVTFKGNTANRGGGMFNARSSPTLTGVNFKENSAADGGGGIFNNDTSSPSLTNVIFSGNRAGYGAGMANLTGSSPLLVNVAFSGNIAAAHGGGMFNSHTSSPRLVNATFSGNTADIGGGGMRNDQNSSPSLANSILWGNTALDGAQIANDADSVPSIAFSDIQGAYSDHAWDRSLGFNAGGNRDSDPLFVDARGLDGIPGTDDDDLRLRAGSPLVDAGDNSRMPPGITTDLEGAARFFDIPAAVDLGRGTAPIIDLGAYEQHMEHAPVFTSVPLLEVRQGSQYCYEIRAEDPDLILGDWLSFSWPTHPDWLIMFDLEYGQGLLCGTPTAAEVGPHPVVLRVTDTSGLYAEQAFTILVKPWYWAYLPLVLPGP